MGNNWTLFWPGPYLKKYSVFKQVLDHKHPKVSHHHVSTCCCWDTLYKEQFWSFMFLENLKNLLSSRDIFFHALALKFFSSWAGEGKFDQKVSKDSWNANSVDEAELNLKLLLTPSCISDKDPIFQCPFLRRKITFKRRIFISSQKQDFSCWIFFKSEKNT